MRKIIIALALLFIFTGCAGNGPEAGSSAGDPPLIDLPQNVGIIDAALSEEGGVLRIASLYYDVSDRWSHGMLTDAKRIFEREFPGWKAEIEPEGKLIVATETYTEDGVTYTNTVSRADEEAAARFRHELPGRLARNDGPDIIVTAGADTQRLIEEDRLMDMFSLFAADDRLSLDKLLPGVVSVMSTDRGLFAIPVSFSTRTLWIYSNQTLELTTQLSDKPERWEWEELPLLFADELEKNQLEYLFAMPPRIVTQMMVGNYFTYIYDFNENAYGFNSPVFREILRIVKQWYDRGLLWDIDHTEEFLRGLEGGLFLDVLLRGNIQDYTAFELKDNWSKSYPLPALRGTEGLAIIPMDVFAISQNAPNKTAAWEFIKILLSDEIQNGLGMTYQPVLTELSESAVKRNTIRFQMTPEEVRQYNNERFAFFSGINRISERNNAPDVMSIILEQADRYYSGEVDMDEMITDLQREVEQRLAGFN